MVMSIGCRQPTARGRELQNQLLFIIHRNVISMELSQAVQWCFSLDEYKRACGGAQFPECACELAGIHTGMCIQISATAKGACPPIYFHLVCMVAPTPSTVPPRPNNLLLLWVCRSSDLKSPLCQRCLIKLVMRSSKFGSCAEGKQMFFEN